MVLEYQVVQACFHIPPVAFMSVLVLGTVPGSKLYK
jgi:hypothetical protein